MNALLAYSFLAAEAMLGLALVCAAIRLMRGPRAQDRVLALDTMYVNSLILLLVFGMQQRSTVYFEAAVVIAVLGFVSTAAAAKFLMRGEVIE